jgi:hypothetical protein
MPAGPRGAAAGTANRRYRAAGRGRRAVACRLCRAGSSSLGAASRSPPGLLLAGARRRLQQALITRRGPAARAPPGTGRSSCEGKEKGGQGGEGAASAAWGESHAWQRLHAFCLWAAAAVQQWPTRSALQSPAGWLAPSARPHPPAEAVHHAVGAGLLGQVVLGAQLRRRERQGSWDACPFGRSEPFPVGAGLARGAGYGVHGLARGKQPAWHTVVRQPSEQAQLLAFLVGPDAWRARAKVRARPGREAASTHLPARGAGEAADKGLATEINQAITDAALQRRRGAHHQ